MDPRFFACYTGEFRSASGEVVKLVQEGRGLILEVDDLPWRNTVRPLSRRVFAYDPFGSDGETPGQIVFELDDSGGALSLYLGDPDLGIELSASRVRPAAVCTEGAGG